MPKIPEKCLAILRCPACLGAVSVGEEELACIEPSCSQHFPIVDGLPVLINEANSVFRISTFTQRRPTYHRSQNRIRSLISGLLPEMSQNVMARRYFETLRTELHKIKGPRRVLILGGGILGVGIEPLVIDPKLQVIETDIAFAPRTQLICDGHNLPFEDASLDAVVAQAVLEHVVDPNRCMEEIYRVLKPNGLIVTDTPFIQQVHGREFDFTRFTRLGQRRLLRQFDEIESGITGGPGQALAWSLRYFMLSFFSTPLLRGMASGLSRAAFFWLKYLDRFLKNKPGANDAASGFYFVGRKSENVLSDRELLSSYNGGF